MCCAIGQETGETFFRHVRFDLGVLFSVALCAWGAVAKPAPPAFAASASGRRRRCLASPRFAPGVCREPWRWPRIEAMPDADPAHDRRRILTSSTIGIVALAGIMARMKEMPDPSVMPALR
jgi:hypothetical protein